MIILQAPQMEVSRKREVESIDEVPRVTTNSFLAEKQDVERVAKMQKVESKEGKPHLTTNSSLAEKQEVETAKKPYSKNKNEEVAMPVESPEASKSSSDSDPDEGEYWPIMEIPDDQTVFQPLFYQWSDGYGDSDSGDERYKKWKRENVDGSSDSDGDSDSDDETHKKWKEENVTKSSLF